jgi:hypothetical protein
MKYVADVRHVKEVSLSGGIDHCQWADDLSAEGLEAIATNGRSLAMLSATDASFRGIRFRELSISLRVRHKTDGAEGWFLLHAFNSLRFFAWIERTMFSTPYYAGRVTTQVELPALMEAQDASGGTVNAAMGGPPTRQPTRIGLESWSGPIFLPALPGRPRGRQLYFHAVLEGMAQAFPFVPSTDELAIGESSASPIFAQLRDANFTPAEWLTRPDARHAKSKTLSRA